MVIMIAGPAMVSEEEKKKSKQKKRMEERVKQLRSLGHSVNYVICSRGLLSSCSNSLHRVGFAHYKAATSGSSRSEAVG